MWLHLLGALLAFGAGGLNMSGNTFLSRRLPGIPGSGQIPFFQGQGHRRVVLFARFVMSVLVFVFLALAIGLSTKARLNKPSNSTRLSTVPGSGKWDSSMTGYGFHVASSLSEWFTALLITLYSLTFYYEFKHVRIGLPLIQRVEPSPLLPSFSSCTPSSSSSCCLGGGGDVGRGALTTNCLHSCGTSACLEMDKKTTSASSTGLTTTESSATATATTVASPMLTQGEAV